MTELLHEVEAAPAAYPVVAVYPHRHYETPLPEQAVVDPAIVWRRIEAHVAHRWTTRTVVWTVAGPGEWKPRLTPATVTSSERWTGAEWAAVTLAASPLGGLELPGDGPYRITATVGGGTVPEDVAEAFRRLHEYSRGIAESFRDELAMVEVPETTYAASRAGKALQLSGAADLLRPYRRAT